MCITLQKIKLPSSFCLGEFRLELPKNCCVPFCTKKGYVEGEQKNSYFRFTKEKTLLKGGFMQYLEILGKSFESLKILAYAQDIFKPYDLKVSRTSVRELRDGAIPSIFDWKEGSPKKIRKSPRKRIKLPAESTTNNVPPTTSSDEDCGDLPGPFQEGSVDFD